MRTAIFKTIILGLAATLIMAQAVFAQDLPTGKYRLEAYKFEKNVEFPVSDTEVTLNIDEGGKLGGRSSCNVYGSSYTIDDGGLNVEGIISTKMACAEPSMSFEAAFFALLGHAVKFLAEDGTLTISDEEGGHFLKFVAVEEPVTKCLEKVSTPIAALAVTSYMNN